METNRYQNSERTISTVQDVPEYRIIGKKGEGTFSEVLKCQNIKDGGYWACKKMKQSYDNMDQVNNLREIQAMRKLNPHNNILELEEVIFDKKSGTLVLICELMDMNIYELIRGKRHYLQEKKVKNYMYQLLKSIDHMHRRGLRGLLKGNISTIIRYLISRAVENIASEQCKDLVL